MTKEQYTVTGGDESYTYPSLITPITKHIEEWREFNNKQNVAIWLPFDLDKEVDGFCVSNYVKIFKEFGYTIITSHIITGQDFFEYEPKEHYDLIVSNCPFKNKKLFFQRALELNKPFALVTTMSWLNDGGLYTLFKDKQMQLLMPDKRSKFFNDKGCIGKSPSFKAGYVCYDFLINGDIKWFELDRSLDNV